MVLLTIIPAGSLVERCCERCYCYCHCYCFQVLFSLLTWGETTQGALLAKAAVCFLFLLPWLGAMQGLAKSIKQGLRRLVEEICQEDPRRRTDPSTILS